MINIIDKIDCCGCNACGDICNHNAIEFKLDHEGFWYPHVEKEKCTDCGLCDKVCPQIEIEKLKKNDLNQSECYAAIHTNIETRFDSTSGGIFSALAEQTYKSGGYVGGAIFNEDFSVSHFISNKKSDLAALRSSKYLQSDASGFYNTVRELVRKGEQVLVCGTPCQMAALRAFLRKGYDNLIIVDFICRGINSPKIFRKYLDYLEERFQSKVVYFKAKNKELGWRQLTSKIVFKNKQVLYDTKDINLFTIGYLKTGVFCRPSCYDCKFKGFPRIADITIADFWGAEKIVGKELDNDMGTSLVMVNSQKGKAYFETIQKGILCKPIPYESIFAGNRALTKSLEAPLVNRDDFYTDLDNLSFKEVANKYIKSADKKLSKKQQIKKIARFTISVVRASRFSISTYWKNFKYNFLSKKVETDLLNGGYMVIYKHTIVELHSQAKIKVEGPLHIGVKKFKDSKLETRLLVENNATVTVKNAFNIGYGSDIEVFKGAQLYIAGKGGINMNATIICGESITLGEGVMLGRDVTIRDNNGNHYIARRGYKNTRPIIIGQHAWLCEGCTLLAGVKIGDGAIIGAKAVVSSNIASFTLVSGNPAQVVDEDIYWKY